MPKTPVVPFNLWVAGLVSGGLRRRVKAAHSQVGNRSTLVDFDSWATSIMADTAGFRDADLPKRATIDDLTTETLAAVTLVLETRYPPSTVEGPVPGGVNVDTLMFDAGKNAVARDFRAALEDRRRRG